MANMYTLYEQGCKETGSSVSAIMSGPYLSDQLNRKID